MAGKTVIGLMAATLIFCGPGCTYRAWYEGLQERQRQECYNNPSQSEIQKCLESVNSTTYDEYRRKQKESQTGK